MATLNIRGVPDEVHRRLRLRAAHAGRSMEAEARAILAEACMAPRESLDAGSVQRWVDELYGQPKPVGVTDDLIAQRRQEGLTE